MSHSKQTKRGFSLYLNNWNPSAIKYTNTCCICGYKGYGPAILELDFYDKDFSVYSENRAIYDELTKILKPLELDGLGRCDFCAAIQDKK